MRYTAATLVAFASAVLAQTANFDVISKPTEGTVVPAGETYTIVWAPTADYNNDTITLTLLGGATSKTLQTVAVIKAGVANSAGEYDWAVSSSLGANATYGIEITLDSDPSILEYSFPFTISGGSTSSSSSSAVSSAAASSTTDTKKTSTSSSSSSTKTTVATSSSSSSAATTLTTKTSTTYNGNSTTTGKQTGTQTVITSTQTATKTGSSATGTASTVSTSDAKSLGASSVITLIGGLAVAFFAL
ncbi:hypothetical protein SEUCBS139899_008419 [Sporothrix eucalyptigena]|uniref:Yeast cell wall synthesis Kre9/Knh1-like N-terminal domain-containing protein n=1 Tax=Sporothrix eucalyptigena TaxID=1812306 RepID=A0ABP0CBP5_9PEZI